jgi:hypothetical protein
VSWELQYTHTHTHTKPQEAHNDHEFIDHLPLAVQLVSQKRCNVDLLLLSKPHTFLKYFSTHKTAHLTTMVTSVEYCLSVLAVNVDCSHLISLSLNPTADSLMGNNLVKSWFDHKTVL